MKYFTIIIFFIFISGRADYFCVKNDTQQSLTFRLFKGHYDVYKYEFSTIKGGLINKTKNSDNYNITLLPHD